MLFHSTFSLGTDCLVYDVNLHSMIQKECSAISKIIEDTIVGVVIYVEVVNIFLLDFEHSIMFLASVLDI